MSIHLLNRSIYKTYDWLYYIADRLGEEEPRKALAALRAVLHVLRDHIPVENIANLGDQLPTMIRGMFFENWRPSALHNKDRKRDEFLDQVQGELSMHPEIGAEEAVSAVFRTLANKISQGEIEKVKSVLPKTIREMLEESAEGFFTVKDLMDA